MIRKIATIAENQRGLLIKDGRLIRMLDPGRHVFWDWADRLRIEIVFAEGVFTSPWAQIIDKRHPKIAAEYFAVVHPREGEVSVVRLDGRARFIVPPDRTALVWRVLNDVSVETFDVLERPRLSRAELTAFEPAAAVGAAAAISVVAVPEANAGLVFFDGELI